MSGNKKKFQLRWIVGLLLVAAFEFYTWRNGRSVDDYGNVGPLGAGSMLIGTPSTRHRSSSQRRRSMSKSMVREQLE